MAFGFLPSGAFGINADKFQQTPALNAPEPGLQQQMPQRRGMFGGSAPSRGQNIAGILGDMISTASGGQAMFMPMMMHQRQRQMELDDQRANMLARQQMEAAEWDRRQAWQRANPAPDELTQRMRAAGIDPASPEGQQVYRNRIQKDTELSPTVVSNGDGTFTVMPRVNASIGTQAQSSGPAVGTVRDGYRFMGGNPNDRNSWQAVGQDGGSTASDAGSAMAAAMNSKVISQRDWQRIQQALGPNGQAAANAWLQTNGIRVGAQ